MTSAVFERTIAHNACLSIVSLRDRFGMIGPSRPVERRRRPVRAVLLPVLAALAGAVWAAAGGPARAQIPDAWAWPETNFDKALVDLAEITSGGPPRDGIPPIDAPEFDDAGAAARWLDPREPVIVLTAGGETRAYPLQVLMWHEIANDTVGGVPVSVTFCPLCNASIVFDRRAGGRVLDFGTTGKLRKSDLVMYDRQTGSWWQQFTGRAIVGDMAGTVLARLPASIVAFEDFARAHPEAPVLSRRTGHSRAYGSNPYRGYDAVDGAPFLFFDPLDPRLPAMERVLNVTAGAGHVLYPFSVLAAAPVVNDVANGVPVVVMSREGTLSVLDRTTIADSRVILSATAFGRTVGGRVLEFERRDDGRIVDRETGSTWNLLGTAVAGALAGTQLPDVESGVHFAFAWLAFNPDSRIYRPPAGH